jgi:outer membrane usher protein
MPPLRSRRCGRALPALLVALTLVAPLDDLAAASDQQKLQLEVFLNERPTNLIAAFVLLPDRRIAAARKELEEIGLKPRRNGAPEEVVALDDLGHLSYRYDEAKQQLFMTVSDELRQAKRYDLALKPTQGAEIRSDYGAVLNYNLFAAAGPLRQFSFGGASATLDGRAFSPYGVLSQSAILTTTSRDHAEALRLETSFTYSDQPSLTTYRAGDMISGGLAWTRPIRIGGGQMQRNFALRPDLVTLPLPSFSGSAAVPSTIEVYINNLKTFSDELPQGPYSLTNIPAVAGAGMANVVIRDSGGHEIRKTLPFYTSAQLLRPGFMDFSLEAGFPRVGYGTVFDSYLSEPVAAASLRRGIFDWLTVEAHAEAGLGVANGGAGLTATTGSLGAASLAASSSTHANQTGFQVYASYEASLLGFSINAALQRTFGPYEDLASITARAPERAGGRSSFAGLSFISPYELLPLFSSARPPKALYRVSGGFPLPYGDSTVSASYIHLDNGEFGRSNLVSASWARTFGGAGTVSATAFADLADRATKGFFFTWSVPIGEAISASAALSRSGRDIARSVDILKPLAHASNSFGWRLRGTEGAWAEVEAAGGYRSSYGRIEGSVAQGRTGSGGTVEIEGAVATIGGGVFFANRIDDAFAVVETGVPGLEVFHENRPVGRTDANGRAFIPRLRAYEKNKIAVDPGNAPINAEIKSTQEIVAPADRAGIRVDMAVRTDTRSAIVVLTSPDGKAVPAGSAGALLGGESFVVGYDGRAFITDLKAENEVAVELPSGQCRASFSYAPHADRQVVIGPVACR